MEKILAGGANTDEKEIAAFEQKASFKIRVVRNAYRFCSVVFTALLLCLAGCGNEWDVSKDLTIGQDWLVEAETDTAPPGLSCGCVRALENQTGFMC